MASPPVLEAETIVGPLLLHADQVIAPVRLRDRAWEPCETRFLEATLRPGQTFVDVGAHVGYFSVLASRRVGPTGTVIAVEPETGNAALLRRNLARNGCANTRVLEVAAGSSNGPMSLEVDHRNGGGHRVLPLGATKTAVRCVRLDDVLPTVVDVVKIDTQGLDHEVVTGLERTVAANPQLILIVEVSLLELERRGTDPRSVLAGYRRRGFTISAFAWRGSSVHEVSDEEVIEVCRARQNDIAVLLERRLPPRRFDRDDRPRAMSGLELVEGPDRLEVVQRTRGRAHHLNASAASVLALCDGRRTVAQIAVALGTRFGLSDVPESDVSRCVDSMSAAGLVV